MGFCIADGHCFLLLILSTIFGLSGRKPIKDMLHSQVNVFPKCNVSDLSWSSLTANMEYYWHSQSTMQKSQCVEKYVIIIVFTKLINCKDITEHICVSTFSVKLALHLKMLSVNRVYMRSQFF